MQVFLFLNFVFVIVVEPTSNALRMGCIFDVALNKTVCSSVLIKSGTLGPYFQLTVDVEYSSSAGERNLHFSYDYRFLYEFPLHPNVLQIIEYLLSLVIMLRIMLIHIYTITGQLLVPSFHLQKKTGLYVDNDTVQFNMQSFKQAGLPSMLGSVQVKIV